jgi:hypothetical protein
VLCVTEKVQHSLYIALSTIYNHIRKVDNALINELIAATGHHQETLNLALMMRDAKVEGADHHLLVVAKI